MAAAMNVVENDVPEPLKEFVDKNDFAQKAIANYCNPQVDKLQWTKHQLNPLQ
jgi:hypothetical protein